MLTCENLCAQADQKLIFKNLNFTAAAGSMIMIEGKNGSGKTTLLKKIALFAEIDESILENHIYWNQEIINEKNKSLYWQNIAYFGHQNTLFYNLSVLENLEFWSNLCDRQIMLPAVIEIFDLHSVLQKKCHQLSQGWQKRVSLSRLIFFDAVLWLLDEPFINLDYEGQKILWNILDSRTKQDGIVIFTNNMNLSLQKKLATINMGYFL